MTAANQLILVLVKFEKDNKFANVDEDKKKMFLVNTIPYVKPEWKTYFVSDQDGQNIYLLQIRTTLKP